jgi:hypothetical protein
MKVALLFLSALGISAVSAVPVVSLHSSNAGIGTLSFVVSGNTITINENWTSNGIGALLISGLDIDVSYTVVKVTTNNTGSTWTRFANELLDPSGQDNDGLDVIPYPSFVPANFTTSNDSDGLSFAQGGGIPRIGGNFASSVVDELTDVRDFIDFFNGTVANGGVNTVSYGLLNLRDAGLRAADAGGPAA